METIAQSPGLFLAIIGWAATAWLVLDAKGLHIWQRGGLLLATWMVWLIPALDVVVYQGAMSGSTAIAYGGTLTGALVFVVLLSLLSDTFGKRRKR